MTLEHAGPRWPSERPWCWAGDAGWFVELPPDAAAELVAAATAAPDLCAGITIDVREVDDGDVRQVAGDELRALVSDRTGPLRQPPPPDRELDDDEILVLADAAQALAVVLDRWLDHAGPTHPDAGAASTWAEAAVRTTEELLDAVRRRIRPRRDGTFRVGLGSIERRVIGSALHELADTLGDDDPSLRRLFPTAYPDDAERQAGWAALVHGELIESRRAQIATVIGSLDRSTLTEAELSALMRAVNDLRLVLGTRLDVAEDGRPSGSLDEASTRLLALHEHLGLVLDDIVAALRSTL